MRVVGKTLGIALLVLCGINSTIAQNKYTISGHLRDRATGEELIGATVYVDELKTGTTANIYGFYSITLPEGTYHLTYSFLGMNSLKQEINLTENTRLDLELGSKGTDLAEFEVIAEDPNENVTSTAISVQKINIEDIETLPVLFGEKDVLKTIQLLPGVSAAGEGNTGFYVRGGSTDQNLILLDEAPVYNPSHLLGFFSVFNSDALKDLTLYKGGIPAQYGGRASSVLDIYAKNGNNKQFSASGGIGLISSRLTLEAPIIKDKSSFIISGRRTYADLLLRTFDDSFSETKLYFWDVNMKANYTINENNRLFLSGYFGKDNFGLGRVGLNWGNSTATLRWNHIFSDKIFANTSILYSKYNYEFLIERDDDQIAIGAGIEDWNFKTDFDYYVNPNNKVKFGFNTMFHTFEPGVLESDSEEFNDVILDTKYALESSVYLSNETTFSPRLKANYGVRFSMFNVLGPGDVYTYDQSDDIVDTTTYGSGENIATYTGFEPRLSLTYSLTEHSSFKGSYNRMYQYLHQLSNSTSTMPTDIWVPSSASLKPQIADQIALGYFRNFKKSTYEASVEVYYKDMQNQTDFENGADILLNDKIESQILSGDGWSYGTELFIKKRTGRFTGWLSYTLSKTMYQFDEINEGKAYSAKQDRTHDVSLVGMYKLSDKWALSATWVYQTGNAVTFPSGKYEIEGQTVSYYTERNGYRMPSYHRLDLGATWYNKKSDKFESSWNFGLYNAYNRHNAYSISFEESETNPGTTEAVQLSLFGIVPSVTYNFKF